MEPKHKHDCSDCKFIGRLDNHDIYVCPQDGHPTIVMRYGDKGSEYSSGPKLVVQAMHNEKGDLEAFYFSTY